MSRYMAPKMTLKTKRIIEIPLVGLVAAGAHLGLVSSPIPFPFRVTQIKMVFTDDAQNLVRYYPLVSSNRNVSTTSVSDGENLLARQSPVNYFIGKALAKTINCNVEVPETNMHLKVHTLNGAPTPYYTNVTIRIEEL